MATLTVQAIPKDESRAIVPHLHNGDYLTATEFLRRYQAMPHLKRAELLEGIVYMGSPVSYLHGKPDGLIQGWLFHYAVAVPGVEMLPNTTVKLDAENVVQPDAMLRLLPERGGKVRVGDDALLFGPPELVVEIASSNVSIDARQKRRSYLRAGVREYLLWRTEDAQFDWWVLEADDYHINAAGQDGIIRSRHFDGLWLNLPALLAFDAATVLKTLDDALRQRPLNS